MKRAVWWIKRDFRLADNLALTEALAKCDEVIPLFVFEPEHLALPDTSPMHVHAWTQALTDLRANLQHSGGDLLIARGDIRHVLTELQQRYPFTHLFSHEETGNNWTYRRDLAVRDWCCQHAVNWRESPQNGVVRRLRTRDNRSPIIQQRLLASATLPAPSQLKFPTTLASICARRAVPSVSEFFSLAEYPEIQWDVLQTVSETQAHIDLQSFLTVRGHAYSGGISSPNSAFTAGSRLSVHLAWGTLSLRTAFQRTYARVTELKESVSESKTRWLRSLRAFESRLHWHCHFIQRLESAPHMEFHALNPAYEHLTYQDDPEKLRSWAQGRTGFPMIDACMRCLAATGFLNFRMRSMVVSFACFGLHLDWRAIHPHLASIFLDYEPGIHLSQLQMQAGIVGINTIRVYSPTKQIMDQDPHCTFIKKWIPELRSFTPEEILYYETINLGTYPAPIVDFKINSKAMKDYVFTIRKSSVGKSNSAQVLNQHGSRKSSKKKSSPKKKKSEPTLKEDDQMKLF